jgi:hypothetical protein
MIGLRLAASLLVLAASLMTARAANIVTPMQSQPGASEFDTADNGGQIGGMEVGIDYALQTLRCPTTEAIVGLAIARSDVIASMQIACGRPTCDAQQCSWVGTRNVAAATTSSGIPLSAMTCDSNEMVYGVRGRVVTMENPAIGYKFDYAADLEIRCGPIMSAGPLFAVDPTRVGGWHHASGHLGNVPGSYLSYPISCPTGGVTAISLGISKHLRQLGRRVVQAVSLYCPAALVLPKPYSDLSPGSQQAASRCFQGVTDPYRNWQAVEWCILKTVEFDTGRLPNLMSGGFQAQAPSSPTYNCYAYAIPEDPLRWVGPRANLPAQPGDIAVSNPSQLFNLFKSAGWTEIPVTRSPLSAGEQRAVLYATQGVNFQHAALWTSQGITAKMGELAAFRFQSLDQMTGGNFGQITKMFTRTGQ